MGTYFVKPFTDAGPNDAALVGGGTVHALAVDDPVGSPDDGTTALQGQTAPASEAWGLTPADIDAIPVRERIDSIAYFTRWRGAGSGSDTTTAFPGIRIGGADYMTTPVATTSPAFTNRQTAPILLNPATSNFNRYWLREDLRNGQFRFDWSVIPGILPRTQLTQAYIVVNTTDQPYDLAVERAVTGRIMSIPGLRGAGTRHKPVTETGSFPVAWTIPVEGTKDRVPTRSKEGIVTIRMAVGVRDDDPWAAFQAIEQKIENVIESEPSLDGLAFDAWIESWNYADISNSARGQVGVGDVVVSVHRRHARGSS